jgi:hypothetical protein
MGSTSGHGKEGMKREIREERERAEWNQMLCRRQE